MKWTTSLACGALLLAAAAGAQFPGPGTSVRTVNLAFGSSTIITGGSTLYLSIGNADVSATQTEGATPWATASLKKLRCALTAAPGAGKTVTVTIQTGTCGSALASSTVVATISGASATTGDDLTNTVAVAAGQCVVAQVIYDSGAVASVPRCSIELS